MKIQRNIFEQLLRNEVQSKSGDIKNIFTISDPRMLNLANNIINTHKPAKAFSLAKIRSQKKENLDEFNLCKKRTSTKLIVRSLSMPRVIDPFRKRKEPINQKRSIIHPISSR